MASDENSFQDTNTALAWIETIEGEQGLIRSEDIYPKLNDWITRTKPTEILDLGCGQGICSDRIDLSNRRYTGLDSCSLFIDRAKVRYRSPKKKFILGNIYQLPFPDESFDAVFSVAVLHLLKDLTQATQEIARVLKPGGYFLFMTANPGAYSLWTSRYPDHSIEGIRFEGRVPLEDGTVSKDILYLHPLEALYGALKMGNLSITRTETFRPSEKNLSEHYYLLLEGTK